MREKFLAIEQERDKLVKENEALKVKLGVAVGALTEMAKPHLSRRATYELDKRSDLCDEALQTIQGDK